MEQMNKQQLQKMIDLKRNSPATELKYTAAELEKIIAERQMISDALEEFEQLRAKIESRTHRPLTDDDIRAYYNAMSNEHKRELQPQKTDTNNSKKDTEFLELKNAFEPEKKPVDADFSALKNAFEAENKIQKDADFSILEAAFSEDNK